jgi:predicted nucleic acid-binding protein
VIVVDASLVVHFLLRSEQESRINQLMADADAVSAPVILDLEVTNTIRRHLLLKQISLESAERAIAGLMMLSIDRCPVAEYIGRIWQLRHNLTAYDASYIALAEALQAPFYTRDTKFTAATGTSAKIILI